MLTLAAATCAPPAVNAQVAAQRGYSTQLLRDPVFDPARVTVEQSPSWPAKQGPFAVAYLGNDGTYQKNRQHFIDFLSQLRID